MLLQEHGVDAAVLTGPRGDPGFALVRLDDGALRQNVPPDVVGVRRVLKHILYLSALRLVGLRIGHVRLVGGHHPDALVVTTYADLFVPLLADDRRRFFSPELVASFLPGDLALSAGLHFP